MSTPLWIRWARIWAAGGVVVGAGLLLYKYTTPTDEELLNKFSPELRRDYERQRELRREEQRQLINIVKETSKSNDPIWMAGPLVAPWEGSMTNEQMFNDIKKKEATRRQQEELERVERELEELRRASEERTQEIVEERMKNWWKFWK